MDPACRPAYDSHVTDSTANRSARGQLAAGWLAVVAALVALSTVCRGQETPSPAHPTRPPDAESDRSTPRETTVRHHRPPDLRTDPEGERRLIEAAGKGFRIRRTSHFAIAYDVPRSTLARLLTRVEGTYHKVHRFCAVRDIPLSVSGTKLEVTFCDDWQTYVARAGQCRFDAAGTYGYYCQRCGRSVFYNIEHAPGVARLREQADAAKRNLEQIEDVLNHLPPQTDRVRLRRSSGESFTVTVPQAYQELDIARGQLRRSEIELNRTVEQLNQSVIQHEVAHHVLFSGGVHARGADNPYWLLEGLAMQFETPPTRPRRTPTSVNVRRLDDFRQAHKEGILLTLKHLISNNRAFQENAPIRRISYAQAWSLVYYLSRKQSDQFAAYVRALANRRPGVSIAVEHEQREFDRFFGPLDGSFVRRWEKQILSLPHRTGEVRQRRR